MRKMHKRTILLIITALIVSMFSAGSSVFAAETPKTTMQEYVEAMQPGWNLGNTFDSVGMGGTDDPASEDETAWGNPNVTRKQIAWIAEQGFNSIRIPVTWDLKTGEAPDYTVDPAFLERIEEVVNWALDEGLYVMLNMHHDSWRWVNSMGDNHDEVLARFSAIWTQIADHFKDHDLKLMFESINEPSFWGEASGKTEQELLDTLNLAFYNIVRNSGGKNDVRPLVLPTIYTSADEQAYLDALDSFLAELDDSNIIVTTHFYGFWPFSVNIAGHYRYDDVTQNHIIETFDRQYDTFVSKGIPVVIGEFGLLGFDQHTGTIEQGEKLKFFEFMINYAQEKGITHMLWDNGQHFNRRTFEWNDPQLYEMMKYSWQGRSATGATDLIFVKKGEPVEDVTVEMNLNNRRLTMLSLGGVEPLDRKIDYLKNDDGSVTIRAGLLEKLTASGEFGQQAELTAYFNLGAPWTFRVIYYDTPVFGESAGQTDSFAIPVQFNGDMLATMEAYYEDGSFAGPQNWTPYKEFSYTFEPDYDANEIILKENFFNETEDGVVNLKFHFWSGNVLEYTITKDGTEVIGKPID